MIPQPMRVGQGVDIHPLVEGRPLILGGVTIPFDRGLDGHSDGDVVAHAACDALLGAAGLDDLGTHFPENDPAFEGASSMDLCRQVAEMVAASGWAPPIPPSPPLTTSRPARVPRKCCRAHSAKVS